MYACGAVLADTSDGTRTSTGGIAYISRNKYHVQEYDGLDMLCNIHVHAWNMSSIDGSPACHSGVSLEMVVQLHGTRK